MKEKYLYNQKNKKDLLKKIEKESFQRITCSFYRYIDINNIEEFRHKLYLDWNSLQILGRVYIAKEGINAQISIPEQNLENFKSQLYSNKLFKDIPLKIALQEGLSFIKLTIKIKNEIVAYKLSGNEYDMTKVGQHLNYKQFNKAIDDGAIIVDLRNYYEGEVGKFKGAIVPDIDTSRDLLPEVRKLLQGKKQKKVLLYCTGGIRCEKASSYLIGHGFNDVNQLKGGIIQYANDVKKNNVKSKFIGKNYVFDHRLGENVTDDIISKCHQCNNLCNNHTNCLNQACHILFIQCEKCANKYAACCSEKCQNFIKLSIEEQRDLFKKNKVTFSAQQSEKIKPKLKNLK